MRGLSAPERRKLARLKWRGHQCQTLQTCSAADREWALSILRRFDIPWIERPPPSWERGGYSAAVFFLPWRDRRRFAYILKKRVRRLLLDYRGSGGRDEYLDALDEVDPADCLLVMLYIGPNHGAYEEHFQELGGILHDPEEYPDYEVWLNGSIGDHHTLSRAQRSVNGKRGSATMWRRIRASPERMAKAREASSRGGARAAATTWERTRASPERMAKRREAASRGGVAGAASTNAARFDPDKSAKYYADRAKVAAAMIASGSTNPVLRLNREQSQRDFDNLAEIWAERGKPPLPKDHPRTVVPRCPRSGTIRVVGYSPNMHPNGWLGLTLNQIDGWDVQKFLREFPKPEGMPSLLRAKLLLRFLRRGNVVVV